MTRRSAVAPSVSKGLGLLPALVLALIMACLALLPVLALLPATVASAAAVRSTVGSSSVDYVSILSAGGYALPHGWRLTVAATASPKSVSVTASIAHAFSPGSAEEHQWEISKLPASSVSSIGAGSWRVNPPAAEISPVFKAFDLTFKTTSRSPVACTSGSETEYKGTLSGSVLLDTGFRSLGTVGAARLSFNSPNLAVLDHSCSQRPVCASNTVAWAEVSASAPTSPAASGVTMEGTDRIVLTRATQLARPANAGRADVILGVGPPPSLNGKTLSVTTKAVSIIKGSATFNIDMSLPPETSSCWAKGVEHTQHVTSSLASVSSSLHAKTLLTGTIATPASGEGTITRLSYS